MTFMIQGKLEKLSLLPVMWFLFPPFCFAAGFVLPLAPLSVSCSLRVCIFGCVFLCLWRWMSSSEWGWFGCVRRSIYSSDLSLVSFVPHRDFKFAGDLRPVLILFAGSWIQMFLLVLHFFSSLVEWSSGQLHQSSLLELPFSPHGKFWAQLI
jgi:hypothetical protein